jgi:hypothetical protein
MGKLHHPIEAIFIHTLAVSVVEALWKKVTANAQMAKGTIVRAQSLFSSAFGSL